MKCKHCRRSIYSCRVGSPCSFAGWVHHDSYSHACQGRGDVQNPSAWGEPGEASAAEIAVAQDLMSDLEDFNPDDDRWSADDVFDIVVRWAARHGVDADGGVL